MNKDLEEKRSILEALDNKPAFVAAAGPGVVGMKFVQDAIAAKRSGRIAHLADFIPRETSAMDAAPPKAELEAFEYLAQTVGRN